MTFKKTMTAMMTLIAAVTMTCCVSNTDNAEYSPTPNPTLTTWKAGEKVSDKDVETFGIEKCFVSENISDSVFNVMKGKTYKDNCTVPRSDLRYLKVLHRNIEGETVLGELVCNKAVAADFIDIFRTLYDARYPIERMVLIDNYNAQDDPSMEANNSSCFNFRFIAGTTTLSNHSMGMAIDINPLYNPYVKQRTNGTLYVSPESGRPYADRNRQFDYKIDHNDLCYKLFKQHGFTWGGDWTSLKVYQHFEK